jgi:hypothetical protein
MGQPRGLLAGKGPTCDLRVTAPKAATAGDRRMIAFQQLNNGPAVQRSIQIFRKIWSERGSQARTSPQKCRYTPGYASATDHAPPFVDLASTSQGLRSGMSVFGLKWYQVVEGLLSISSSRSNQNRSCPVNAFDDP